MISWGSALLNITAPWGKVHAMHDLSLEYHIDVHMMIAAETQDPVMKRYHTTFADKCALELANRHGWFTKERALHATYSKG